MSRARELAKLGNTDAIGIDGIDLRAGSVTAGTNLDVASNINITGVVTATNFFGEGSGLTGLTAVGSGVTVLRDDNSIGGITKLNFDNTFSVTDPASGITTVRSGVTTADPRSATLVVAGISTLQNVTAGVVTANQFSGDISGVAATFTSGITGIATGATEAVNAFGLLGTPNVTIGFNTATKLTTIDLTSTDANITGIATAGIATITELFATSSQLLGVTTATEIDCNGSIEIIGFTTITNGGVSALGVMTATTFVGDVTGIATGATEAVNAFGLLGSPSITVIDILAAGIVTAQELHADDSGKVEILGFTTITNGGVNATGVGTFSAIDGTSATITGIITANAHVDSGITTYYGDSSYSAAGRWVLGASGFDHYTFTGPGLGYSTANDPELYLKRGFTYMFENKMGAHPFRIQSTTNGATGTQWNVGVTNNDVSNGVLIFEVPFATPDTLYYQCTSHANMGGVINIS
mgnify:CR=1 FL=1|tara:strand:- start:230 stop:1636 length:1407 start_codon:yes stop_codon:yes gene_type:complete